MGHCANQLPERRSIQQFLKSLPHSSFKSLVSATKKFSYPQRPIAQNELRIRITRRIFEIVFEENVVNATGAQMGSIDGKSQRRKISRKYFDEPAIVCRNILGCESAAGQGKKSDGKKRN